MNCVTTIGQSGRITKFSFTGHETGDLGHLTPDLAISLRGSGVGGPEGQEHFKLLGVFLEFETHTYQINNKG